MDNVIVPEVSEEDEGFMSQCGLCNSINENSDLLCCDKCPSC